MKYKVFANHAHVFPEESKPQGTVEKLLELMEECDIDKAVCFAPFHGHYEYFGLKGEPNEFLAEKLAGKELDDSAFFYEKTGYAITLQKLEERND